MKQILIILVSTLMLSPAMAFNQTDLDNLDNYEQLFNRDDVNMDGIAAGGLSDITDFLGGRKFTCVAKNRRGARYKAQGKNLRRVRRRAMRKCRQDSFRPRTCQIVRCKRRGGKLGDFIDLVDAIDDLVN